VNATEYTTIPPAKPVVILPRYSLKSISRRRLADRGGVDPHAVGAPPTLDDIAARSAQKMRAENFPVALRALPARPRDHLTRVYAYARFVDDVGDTAAGDRRALLDQVEADLRALGLGSARLPAVAGLEPVFDACEVPLDPFVDLIEANRVDQRTLRYESFDDLLGYCQLSAAPVGRIVLHIAAAATIANVADSDAVCAALQVLEHCQDVGEDARAGRVYLPAADLRETGVTDADLLAATTCAGLRRAVAVQVGRSDELLGAGRDLVRRLSGWPRIAVSGYLGGGIATAEALRGARYHVLERTIRPSKLRTVAHATRLTLRP
jgi:squalene synthase HpnC